VPYVVILLLTPIFALVFSPTFPISRFFEPFKTVPRKITCSSERILAKDFARNVFHAVGANVSPQDPLIVYAVDSIRIRPF
jgi:hypothetical protein